MVFIGARDQEGRERRAAGEAMRLKEQGISRDEAIRRASEQHNVDASRVSNLMAASTEFEKKPEEFVSQQKTYEVEVEGKKIRGTKEFIEEKIKEKYSKQEQEAIFRRQKEVAKEKELHDTMFKDKYKLTIEGDTKAKGQIVASKGFVELYQRRRQEQIDKKPKNLFGASKIDIEQQPEGARGFYYRVSKERERAIEKQKEIERTGKDKWQMPYQVVKSTVLSAIEVTKYVSIDTKKARAATVAFIAQPTKTKAKTLVVGAGVVTYGIGEELRTRPGGFASEQVLYYKGFDVAKQVFKAPKTIQAKAFQYRINKALKGKPTSDIAGFQVVEKPQRTSLDYEVTYKPLERIEATQVVRGGKAYEVLRPVYGKTTTAYYSELQAQPPTAKIAYETSIIRRDILRSPKKATLPSRDRAIAFDVERSGEFYVRQRDLSLFETTVGRVRNIELPQGVADVRRWAKTTAYLIPEAPPRPQGFRAKGKEPPYRKKIYAPALPEPPKKISYTLKLGGKQYLITESGEILGGIKYGYGQRFIKAPDKLRYMYKKKPFAQPHESVKSFLFEQKFKGNRKFQYIDKPDPRLLERRTMPGLITIQIQKPPKPKLKQRPELKQLQQPQQELKYGIIEDVKVKQKAETITRQKVRPLQDIHPFSKVTAATTTKAGLVYVSGTLSPTILKTSSGQLVSQIPSIKQAQIPALDVTQQAAQIPIQKAAQIPVQEVAQDLRQNQLQQLKQIYRPRPTPSGYKGYGGDGRRIKTPDIDIDFKSSKFKIPSYDVQVKRFGKWKTFKEDLPIGRALKTGSEWATRTLGASFRLQPSGFTKMKDIDYQPDPSVFREYKIRKGQRVSTPLTFIEKSKFRLSQPEELGEIKMFRRRK